MEAGYSKQEMEGLDRLHEDQKKEGWIPIRNAGDIDALFEIEM